MFESLKRAMGPGTGSELWKGRYRIVPLEEWREHARINDGLCHGSEAQDYSHAFTHIPDDFDGWLWFFPLGVPEMHKEKAREWSQDYVEYLIQTDNANYQWFVSEERLYQLMKKSWDKHESSWYFRKADGYDNQGCNQFTGCIPECPFFPDAGRLSKDGIISHDGMTLKALQFRGRIPEDHF